jgi:hypothetical protein
METPGQVELDLSEAAARPGGLVRTQYAAGDHVALAPENDPAEAAALRCAAPFQYARPSYMIDHSDDGLDRRPHRALS